MSWARSSLSSVQSGRGDHLNFLPTDLIALAIYLSRLSHHRNRLANNRDDLESDRDRLGRDRDALGCHRDRLGRDRGRLGRDRDSSGGFIEHSGSCSAHHADLVESRGRQLVITVSPAYIPGCSSRHIVRVFYHFDS
jgi:hypothetical protein